MFGPQHPVKSRALKDSPPLETMSVLFIILSGKVVLQKFASEMFLPCAKLVPVSSILSRCTAVRIYWYRYALVSSALDQLGLLRLSLSRRKLSSSRSSKAELCNEVIVINQKSNQSYMHQFFAYATICRPRSNFAKDL